MLIINRNQLRALAVSILLSAGLASAESELETAGIAVYTDTARDIYIAGLLTPDATVPDNLTEASGPLSMEYRIATRRISSRGFSGTILLQSELGTGQRAPDRVVDALGELKQKIQGSLLSGDQFRTSLSAEGVTSFSLNGEELLDVNDPEVFAFLLAGWVGGSSSALMRDRLLSGKLDAETVARFESLTPSRERVLAVAEWSAPEDDAATDDDTEADDDTMRLVSAPSDNEIRAVASAVAVQQVATAGKRDAAAAANSASRTESKLATTAASEQSASDAEQVAEAAADKEPGLAESQVALAAAAVAGQDDSGDDQQAQLELLQEVSTTAVAVMDDREYKRLLSEYVGSVMGKVLRNVSYPRRAVARENEGSVEILAQLNEKGELIEISMESSSGYKLLDRAAVKAVEDAAPFPQLSDIAREEFLAADGEHYVMMIPVKFKLQQ